MSGILAFEGTIRRRLLVNFRVTPDVLVSILPPPFEPRLVRGWGMAGICLIGLSDLRPQGLPSRVGLRTENVAHRIAVEWNTESGRRQGVYIPRRDTNSLLTRALGGRFFPGIHHRGFFSITEDCGMISVRMRSADGVTDVFVRGRVGQQLTEGSVFESLTEASKFFEVGSLGFSPSANFDRFQGLELVADRWQVDPLQIEAVESSFFRNTDLFASNSVEFDSALVMRGIPCRWRSFGSMESGPMKIIRVSPAAAAARH